ncbi:MAG: MBL fold metallo-hydrolase [Anaerolineales bacterium]|nr:MBL fold metallo-hydrolase [Anaerolineales bacterium]
MRKLLYLLALCLLFACQPTSTTKEIATTGVIVADPDTPTPLAFTQIQTSEAVVRSRTPIPDAAFTITVLFDNIHSDPSLQTSWGFAALVESDDHTLLFDTGEDGVILLNNMGELGVDPDAIETILLSHIHGDHTNGLYPLLETGIQPTIYIPHSFPAAFTRGMNPDLTVIEAEPGLLIHECFYTTGEIDFEMPEQALIVDTPQGLVVITGCAHPGIVRIIEHALELIGGHVYLVMGGFHLGNKSTSALEDIIADFRRLGVQKVAPSHCTGEQAIAMFNAEYGADFIHSGVGHVLVIKQ